MNRLSFLVPLLLLLLLAESSPANADDRAIKRNRDGRRTALVIGNGAYAKTPLKNSVNDANDMAGALSGCGFDVVKLIDADRAAMRRGVRDFASRIKGSGVGLFFYAGHGVQVRGENYLVPLGADVRQEFEIDDQCLKVDYVLGAMEEAGNGLNIIILDACRNNPFRSFRGDKSGLAHMDAPTGSLIAFSTATGAVAEDGDGRNGVYTGRLLKHIRTPGLRLLDLFIQVRNEVRAATGGHQVPWENQSLTAPFYFLPGRAGDEPSQAGGQDLSRERQELEREKQELAREKDRLEKERLAMAPRPDPPKPKPDPPTSGGAKPGQTWTEPTTGMEFVWVPGGCFQMGSPPQEAGRFDNEGPVHEVCVDGFWMGKYEITQGQWSKVMGGNPSYFKKGERHPVEQVSWNDIKSFISRLSSANPGVKFSLPSEAQWEYACRSGGKPEKYCGGNNVDGLAWYSGNSGSSTHPVGTKSPNGLGLYDMSGNVWEWCEDVYDKNGYSSHSRQNPLSTGGGSYRVFRGGSWISEPRYVRSADRNGGGPGNRGNDLGARLLRSP